MLVVDDLSLTLVEKELLKNVSFTIKPKEKVALVGRNGAGKSTLFKTILNIIKKDKGKINLPAFDEIIYISQDFAPKEDLTIYQFLKNSAKKTIDKLEKYNQLLEQNLPEDQSEIQNLHNFLDLNNSWNIEHKICAQIDKLKLEKNTKLKNLSGGKARLVNLSRIYFDSAKLLLLDEPTNHLDIAAIYNLENYLKTYKGICFFISHDLTFINNVATKILDLDRGKSKFYQVPFYEYRQNKLQDLEIEETHFKKLDKKLKEEEAWLAQGIKARGTRNVKRLKELYQRRDEQKTREKSVSNVKINISESKRASQIIYELDKVSFYFEPENYLIKDFSVIIKKRQRIALIGKNGSGKTSFIKMLLGELKPVSGTIKKANNLKIAYFEQNQKILNEDEKVIDSIADGARDIEINGKNFHVSKFLSDFLFTKQMQWSKISSLSGGEKNRLLLAKIFLKPSNVLILDEPTNDIEIETLELLEEVIKNYQGTVIIISHDRNFIDSITTDPYLFSNSNIETFVGNFSFIDPKKIKNAFADTATTNKEKKQNKDEQNKNNKSIKNTKKLTYKEKELLKNLPKNIEKLEDEISKTHTKMQNTLFFKEKKSKEEIENLAKNEKKLQELYEVWEELETKT